MNKELPKMYHSNFDKEIKNNETFFSTLNNNDLRINKKEDSNKDIKFDRFSIEQKIFNIFNAKDYIYKADVTIVTDTQTIKKRIVGKNGNNLITMDNEYIPISIIRDIYKS